MPRKAEYTFAEMKRALVKGWGDVGERTAATWQEFNRRYFDGRLQPLPIFFTPAAPYGKRLGWTCSSKAVTHIALVRPEAGTFLIADSCTLLHEMIHQYLFEQRLDSSHDKEPWRREIMRLHLELTGEKIWAGRPTVLKEKLKSGNRRSVRVNRPHPDTGKESLTQKEIARWPHSVGIDLGEL